MYRRYKSKKKYSLAHSRLRAEERYHDFSDRTSIEEMARMCRSGKHYCHLGRQSLTRSKMVLRYKGVLVPVIYDKKRHCLITLLTMNMLSAREKALVQSVECDAS